MRSNPANASVICVPILATCTSGAVTRTMKNTKVMRLPTVIRPSMTSRPPTYIAIRPITPTTASPSVPVSDVPVIVLAMF